MSSRLFGRKLPFRSFSTRPFVSSRQRRVSRTCESGETANGRYLRIRSRKQCRLSKMMYARLNIIGVRQPPFSFCIGREWKNGWRARARARPVSLLLFLLTIHYAGTCQESDRERETVFARDSFTFYLETSVTKNRLSHPLAFPRGEILSRVAGEDADDKRITIAFPPQDRPRKERESASEKSPRKRKGRASSIRGWILVRPVTRDSAASALRRGHVCTCAHGRAERKTYGREHGK